MVDRSAAFASGPQRLPRKVVFAFLAGLVVLGLGGVVADHYFSGPVGSSTATTAGTFPPPLGSSTATTDTRVTEGGAPNGAGGQLPASESALMGLVTLRESPAPGFSLTDQSGRTVSLSAFRGKVVVLSFFDGACDDICPVLGAELRLAYQDTGRFANDIAFVTVNTDPLVLNPRSSASAESEAASIPGWEFLSGSLHQLDSVWKSYGVTVEVQTSTHRVSHDDLLYFIGASGELWFRATPFANESTSGVFTLPASSQSAWGMAIADQAEALSGSKR